MLGAKALERIRAHRHAMENSCAHLEALFANCSPAPLISCCSRGGGLHGVAKLWSPPTLLPPPCRAPSRMSAPARAAPTTPPSCPSEGSTNNPSSANRTAASTVVAPALSNLPRRCPPDSWLSHVGSTWCPGWDKNLEGRPPSPTLSMSPVACLLPKAHGSSSTF